MKHEAKRSTAHLSRYVPDLEPEQLQEQMELEQAIRLSLN